MPASGANDGGGGRLCAACLQFLKDAPACSSRRSVGPSANPPACSFARAKSSTWLPAKFMGPCKQTECVFLSVLCSRERC